MKKTLLSLTAAALLCTALPQQTLAGCFGNSKRSDDIKMTYMGYSSVPAYDDGTTQPSNACSQLFSNVYDAIASAGSSVLQHPLFNTTPKRVAWGVVVGTAIASPWLVPAVATAIAGGTTAIGTSNNATDGNAHLPKPEAFDPDAAAANNITQVANNVHNAIEQGNAKWGAHTQEGTQNNVELNEQYVMQHSQDNQDVWYDAQEEQTNSHSSFDFDETNQAFYPSIDSVLQDTMFSWQKLHYIAQHPVDSYGRHLTAGNIQDYANVERNWVKQMLSYANQNTVPGILMDVQGHTYPVTCINTWDMFQTLANDPAAFERFQTANQVQVPQHLITEQSFVTLASQGHDFGDITHYAHFSQHTIINGIRSAMANNLPGMLIHLGPQKIHVACYFVWEKLLQKALSSPLTNDPSNMLEVDATPEKQPDTLHNNRRKTSRKQNHKKQREHNNTNPGHSFDISLHMHGQITPATQNALSQAKDIFLKIVKGNRFQPETKINIDIFEDQMYDGALAVAPINAFYPNSAVASRAGITFYESAISHNVALNNQALDTLTQYLHQGLITQHDYDTQKGLYPSEEEIRLSTALHEMVHHLLPLYSPLQNSHYFRQNPDWHEPYQNLERQWVYSRQPHGFFTGSKTVAYFKQLAEKRGQDPRRFDKGVPLDYLHPRSNTINCLEPAPGFFGEPRGPYFSRGLLYMLEDAGWILDMAAAEQHLFHGPTDPQTAACQRAGL